MPQAIIALVIAIAPNSLVFGLVSTFGPFGLTAFANVIGYGIVIGAGLLYSASQRPKPPRPEDVQSLVKSTVSPRVIIIGEDMVQGTLAFIGSKQGSLHKVVALLHGEAHEISEIRVDDKVVVPGVGGVVSSEPFNGKLTIQVRKGQALETPYSNLTAVFPEWTSSHRGNGIVSMYIRQHALSQNSVIKVFPSGTETQYRMVVKHRMMYDPTDVAQSLTNSATWKWTDNPAIAAMWYMSSPDGMRLPASIFMTPKALEITNRSIEVCNQQIPTIQGGNISRWTCNGYFLMDERPADVLGRILQTCNMRITMTSDGGVAFEASEWVEPVFTVTESMIVSLDNVSAERGMNEAANRIIVTYRSKAHRYLQTEAVAYENADDIALRGELPAPLTLPYVRHHSQAERLAKLAYFDANPDFVLALTLSEQAFEMIGEGVVSVDMPTFGISGPFKVASCKMVIGEGATLSGVAVNMTSTSAAAHAWNHLTDEHPEPPYTEPVQTTAIPEVVNFNVEIDREAISGIQVPYATFTWDNPNNESIKVTPQYKRASDATWSDVPTNSADTSARSPVLYDGILYQFRARIQTLFLEDGPFTTVIAITVIADQTPPGIITLTSATGAVGAVTFNWTAPSSANFAGTHFYRSQTNIFADAVLIQPATFHGPSTAVTWVDGGLAPSTYYYWIKSRNGSGVESLTSVPTGPIIVT